MDDTVDVIVIGAGLSGLAAARSLERSHTVVRVLEAQPRVGGRIRSVPVGDGHLDLGGQWIGPGQDRMARMVQRLGLEKFPTFSRGEKLLALQGELIPYRRTAPPLSALALVQFGLTLTKLDRMRRKVDLDAPWTAKQAERWDAMTLGAWLDRNVSNLDVRAVLASACSTIFGCDPGDVSFLFFLFFLNSSGGLRILLEVQDGAQQDRIVGGMQQVPERLAQRLNDVVLGATVESIRQDDEGVTVTSSVGVCRAKFAVVALPPAAVLTIDFAPELPTSRSRLLQGMPGGSMIKVIACYATPFWRYAGLSGEVLCDAGPFSVVFDDSEHDCRPAALLGFVVGEAARTWSTQKWELRRQTALREFTRLFGSEAAEPLEYLEADWSRDTWAQGGPSSFMLPGVLTRHGSALRQPVGRVHWAGAETATAWTGHMEGAVQAGERAAIEVMRRLSGGAAEEEEDDD